VGSATSTRRSDDPHLSPIGPSENGDGRMKTDEAPAEVPDYLFAFGFGLGTILRYPLEVLGLVG
jgi:hypothetical protein